MKKIAYILTAVVIFASLVIGTTGCSSSRASSSESPLAPKQRVRLATTTSLYDTGLWGYLEPMFEEKTAAPMIHQPRLRPARKYSVDVWDCLSFR